MKTNLFFFAAALLAGTALTACSSDEAAADGSSNGTITNAYVAVNIELPVSNGSSSSAKGTRAASAEDSEVTVDGVESENKVNSAELYFFDDQTGIKTTSVLQAHIRLTSADFSPASNSTVKASVKKAISVTPGKYYCFVVVNGALPSGELTIDTTTLADVMAKEITQANACTYTVDTEGKASLTNGIVMTSRNDLAATSPTYMTEIKATNTINNPATFNVKVERAAGRIAYSAEKDDNTYSIGTDAVTAETNVNVVFTGYKVVNLRNNGYFFRRVATFKDDFTLDNIKYGGDLEDNVNYVIDPKTTSKTKTVLTDWTTFFTGAYIANAAAGTFTTLPTAKKTNETAGYSTLAYAMENTMEKGFQLNGYTTGIVFQAVYKPTNVKTCASSGSALADETYTAGDGFFRYDNKLFKTKADVANYLALTEEKVTEMITAGTVMEYKGTGAEAATKGAYCYYTYWIKHFDNSDDSKMGVMEYGIVRNNTYNLSINKVSGLGESTETITPQDPDEKTTIYFDVKMNILPWIVRAQGIDF